MQGQQPRGAWHLPCPPYHTLKTTPPFCLPAPTQMDVLKDKKFVRTHNDTCGLYGIVLSIFLPKGAGPDPHVHAAGAYGCWLCASPPRRQQYCCAVVRRWSLSCWKRVTLGDCRPSVLCVLQPTPLTAAAAPPCAHTLADDEWFLPGTPGDVVRIHAEKGAPGTYKSYQPGQVPGFNMPAVEVGGLEVPYGRIGYSPRGAPHTFKG